jgi:hypothetical protein
MYLKKIFNNCINYERYDVQERYKKLINGSTISYEGMQLLRFVLKRISPKVSLEFGSGLSTLFLSKIIPKNSFFISVEDSIEYLNKTKGILGKPKNNLVLQYAPISIFKYKFKYFLSYELSYLKHLNNKKLDFVFVDGPLAYKYGREFSLYALIPYITNRTVFILDDSNRTGEQEALFNWKKVFVDGLEIIHLKQIKYGMTVFRINNPKNISRFPFSIPEIIKSIIKVKIKNLNFQIN